MGQFPTILEKACCYYHSIATTHNFKNGNKRTSLVSFTVFLGMHGYSVDLSEQEMEDYTVDLQPKNDTRQTASVS